MKTYLIIFMVALIAIINFSGCAIGIGLRSGGNILGDWKEFHYKVENFSGKEIKIVMHSVNASREIVLLPSGSDMGWFSVINRDRFRGNHIQIIFQFYTPNVDGSWKLVASDSKDIRDGRITIISWNGSGKRPYTIKT